MMNSGTADLGFFFLRGLHIISVIAFFTGVLFFIVLAIKTFKPVQLRNWAISLMVFGTALCLYSIAQLNCPWLSGEHGMRKIQMEKMQSMMQMMTDHDKGSNAADHKEHEEMMNTVRMMMNKDEMPQMENGMMQR